MKADNRTHDFNSCAVPDRPHTPAPGAPSLGRRAALKRMGLLGAASAGLSLVLARPANAKAAKSDFMYQEHPKNDMQCARCKFFTPADDQGQSGSCAIVSGVIAGSGWCLAYVPRT